MRASSLFALGAALTASAESLVPCQESSTPYCPPRSATPEKQRAILNDFIQAFYKERNATKAMLGHVAEDYI
ncbi:snoal-like polyketide cyclase family protein [Colletotrichum sp. SAR 10_86]|nr:snoal-like polyketide cyclase family protein [Colletotrichum sp. SAR 10_86]